MMLIAAWGWALLCLVVVSGAIVGYGLAAAQYSRHARSAPILGLGCYATLILVTGIWGGYNKQVQTLLALVGLAALYTYRSQLRRFFPLHAPKGRDRWWVVLPLAYLAARFFSCGLPQQHSDPLYYHLSAPQRWIELGAIVLEEAHPSYAQATLFEALYGLPMVWLGPHGGNEHVITQVYAQWLHFLWGQVATLALAAVLLTHLVPSLKARSGLAIFVAWLCTTQPAFEWLGTLAKTDYVICSFVLAAMVELLDHRWFIAGMLAGFAYSTKVLAAWFVLTALIFVPWRKWAWYFAGLALAIAPILFRNLWWTHNPFFPVADAALGPHWISSWWNGHNATFGGGPRLDPAMAGWVWTKMLEKALPKVMLGLGIAALTLELALKRRIETVSRARWGAMIGCLLVLTCLVLRPPADGRYGNIVAVLAAIFCMGALLREVERHRLAWRWGWPVLAALALLINIPIDLFWKVPRDYLFQPALHYVEQFHPFFDVQRWVQANVGLNEQILFMGEKQQFYLDRPFETVVEMRKWEEILTPIRDVDALFVELRRLGYRYVHFLRLEGGYPIAIRPYWSSILAREGEAAYRTEKSLIFDLGPQS